MTRTELEQQNAKLRTLRVDGTFDPKTVRDQLERVSRECDSGLHEAAYLVIDRLTERLDEAEDELRRRRGDVHHGSWG